MDKDLSCPTRAPPITTDQQHAIVNLKESKAADLADSTEPTPAHIDQDIPADVCPDKPVLAIDSEPSRDPIQLESDLTSSARAALKAMQEDNITTSNDLASQTMKPDGPPTEGTKPKLDPSRIIPTFEELESQGLITLKDPTPGYLPVPLRYNEAGQRVCIRDGMDGATSINFPQKDFPLWKQMRAACHLWALWGTKVDDPHRRNELLDWASKRMTEAWEFGIANGHCGEPNGHTSCCYSHPPLEHQRKRQVDSSKQPAPFACEGNKHQFSILNRELERAEVTMDAIKDRLTPQHLNTGRDLLNAMCNCLGRPSLDIKDWTIIPRFGKYNPLQRSRNLLMFCLWEVQRCEGVVSLCEASLRRGATALQQQNLGKRIDTHRERADQHLALAVLLDERRSKENDNDGDVDEDDDEEDDDDDVQEVLRPRRSARQPRPISPQQDFLESLVAGDSDKEPDFDLSTGDESEDRPHLGETISKNDVNPMQTQAMNHSSAGDVNVDIIDLEHPEPAREVDQQAVDNVISPSSQTGQKRSHSAIVIPDETDLANKKLKLDNEQADTRRSTMNDVISLDDASHLTSAATMASSASVQHNENSEQLLQGIDQFANLDKQSARASKPVRHIPQPEVEYLSEDISPSTAMHKQRYTEMFWQPKVDTLLEEKGFGRLKWKLKCWSDIRSVLEQLGLEAEARNNLLRVYKDGFATWHQSTLQKLKDQESTTQTSQRNRIVLHLPKQKHPPTQNVASSNQLESCRGFHVRYFLNTTSAERKLAHDMVQEYIIAIVHGNYIRHGYYAVITKDGDSTKKPLAHGIWTLHGAKRPADTAWFFRNLPRPDDFRDDEQKVLHDWGYSKAPPSEMRSSMKSKAASSDVEEETTDEDAVVSSDNVIRTPLRSRTQQLKRGRPQARSAAVSKIRKPYGDEGDTDDEWHPDDE